MNIELWPLSQVKPYPNNPRLNDDVVEAVAASLREFGFRQPIVVDAEGVIVVGHTRYKAALKLGLEKVPVHVAKDLTPEQARAYRIADNKSAELSDWNYDLLPIELAGLQEMNYDLGLLGFDQDELARLLDPGVKDGLCDPDEVPEPPDEATTRPGDLWLLGEHRLLCGDSGKAEDVDRLLGGAAIHLVNTDPPYNVKVEPRSNNAIAAGLSSFGDSNTQPQNHHQAFDVARQGPKVPTHKKLRPKDRPLANDFVSEEAFEKLLHAWFGNIARVLLPGRAFYIWGGYANLGNYPPVLKAHGLYFSQGIVWDKEHPVLTRFGLYLAQGHLQSAGHGDRRYPTFSLHKRRQDLMERIWAKWPRAREYDHNDYRPEPTSGTVVTAFDGEAGLPFGSSSCVRSHSRSNVFQSRCGCDGQLHGHQSAPIRQHCQSAVVRNCHLLRLERPALNRVPLAARAVTNPCRVLRPEQNTLEARHPVPAALSRREGERRRAFSGDLEEGCFCQGQQFTLDLSDPLDLFGKDRQSLGSSGAGVDGVDLLLVEERADDPPTLVTV